MASEAMVCPILGGTSVSVIGSLLCGSAKWWKVAKDSSSLHIFLDYRTVYSLPCV